MNNRRNFVFVLVLMILILAYLYASNKMIVYNHSGQAIEKIWIKTEFMNKELSDVKDGEVLKFSVFAPFNKKVQIKTKTPAQINAVSFSLRGFFLGEEYNQVELTQEGIKQGTLGIK